MPDMDLCRSISLYWAELAGLCGEKSPELWRAEVVQAVAGGLGGVSPDRADVMGVGRATEARDVRGPAAGGVRHRRRAALPRRGSLPSGGCERRRQTFARQSPSAEQGVRGSVR